MSFNTITEEIKNSVHILKLNRPDRLNAWTEEMAKEIKESMSNASKNKEEVLEIATKHKVIAKYVAEKEIKKIIYVPEKVLNLVI